MPQGYHHMDRDQRCQIYTLKERGDSLSAIAQVLEVHRATISRELKRVILESGGIVTNKPRRRLSNAVLRPAKKIKK